MKRTPLNRRQPMPRGAPHQRPRRPRDEISAGRRHVVLARDRWTCRRCGKTVAVTRDYSIHHRLLRSQGGTNAPANLLTLCGSGVTGCHGWVHANPGIAYELGLLVHPWDDPEAVPVLTEPRG